MSIEGLSVVRRTQLTSRFLRAAAAALFSLPLLAVAGTAAAASAVPAPHAPAFGRSIEPMAAYVEQDSCQPGYRAGTLRLANLLVHTYPNTSFGGAYACGSDGTRSEHYDGRAIDWMNSIRNTVQSQQGTAVIHFLLDADKYGNRFAMARRLGVMYIIWNNRIWGAWSGTWSDYNGCTKTPSPSLDNACHRNHMHISLGWEGALGHTSFWTGRTDSVTNYGPCRPSDLNWAANYTQSRTIGCRNYPAVAPPAHSSAAYAQLVKYSGAQMAPGMSGEPVKAIQRILGRSVTGRYDSGTVAAVRAIQRAHGLSVSGVVSPGTWRTMLALFKHR